MDSLNHTATNDSREHYITDILDALPLGVLVFDRELKVQRLNSRAAQLLCIGDDVVKTLVAGTGEQADTEGNWLHELSTIFSDGGIRTYDGINYCANGQQMILRFTCSLAGGEADPQHALAVLVVEEISERVKLQKALSDSERMATIGKLTSKIAHELNNPMDGILRYINLTVRIVEEAGLEKPKKYLLQCRHGIMRMVQIVS